MVGVHLTRPLVDRLVRMFVHDRRRNHDVVLPVHPRPPIEADANIMNRRRDQLVWLLSSRAARANVAVDSYIGYTER